MEFFIFLFIIYLVTKFIFKDDTPIHSNTHPTNDDITKTPSEDPIPDNTTTKLPTEDNSSPTELGTPKPTKNSKVKLTDEEIRQRFEEKYRHIDFQASEVNVIRNNITHCPYDGTVLFNANVVFRMAWYQHIKCCPQCSRTFIEEPIQKVIDFRNNKTILWVCKYQQSCNQRGHATTSAKGLLFRSTFTPIEINIQYCYACNEYFISEAQFEKFKKIYGTLLGNFEFTDTLQNRGAIYKLNNKESKLHLNGYNVNQNSTLSTDERRRILRFVIDSNIITKSEVIYYLSMFIERSKNRKSFQTAISKWQNDLDWVNLYKLDLQQPVWIDTILHK